MEKNNKPKIGIIGGTGRFGRWFKDFFERSGHECLVAGRDTELKPEELARICDIVIISVPIRSTAQVIKKVRDLLRPGALLADFTSVKEAPMREMMKRKEGGVLGTHPLFGPLVASAKGQIVVFCRGRHNHWADYLENLIKATGARVVFLEPAEHDRQMAMVQAMTHFLNISFARVLQKQKIQPQNIFSTPVFRLQSMLAGRIVGGTPSLYADLEIENKKFNPILKQYKKEVDFLLKKVLRGDREGFEKEFTRVSRAMKTFIPIAQAKTAEVLRMIDEQPVEIKRKRQIKKLPAGEDLKIACLGPEGTFSHLAAKNIFPDQANFILEETISQVFKAVLAGEAKFGVVPIENSTSGIVRESLDNLLSYPLPVIGSYTMPIHHFLLGRVKNLSAIKVVRSHSQPLAQCREWLKENLPQAVLEPYASSAKAMLSTLDPGTAFIGSREAAKEYQLEILAENIEDSENNQTEFYALSKSYYPTLSRFLGAKKTAMILTVYDRPGVLRDILDAFAKEGITLTKLHSHANTSKGWDYYFFIELDCLPGDRRFKRALEEVKKHCAIARVLGIT